MALNRCPHCNNPLTADEWLKGTCPGCHKSLASPVTATAPPRAVEKVWDKPAREPAREPAWEKRLSRQSAFEESRVEHFLGWASVRTALSLLVVGMLLYFPGVVFFRLIAEGALRSEKEPEGAVLALMVIFRLAIYLGAAQVISGMCMVVAAPSESGTKVWPVGTIICLLAGGVVLMILAGTKVQTAASLKTLTFLCFASLLLARLLFATFLCAVAVHFRRPGLAGTCGAYILIELIFDVAFFFTTLKDTAAGGPNPFFLVSASWGWTIASLTLGIWFVVMAVLVRGVVTNHLRRSRI